MKILMLSWEYPPRVVGGISRVVHDLSHRLKRREFYRAEWIKFKYKKIFKLIKFPIFRIFLTK